MDNCPAHPNSFSFTDVKFVFPANYNRHVQPLDLGITIVMKTQYYKLLEYVVTDNDADKDILKLLCGSLEFFTFIVI